MIKWLQSVRDKQVKRVVGLMSGTSLDGIDAAVVEIEGVNQDLKVRLLHFWTLPFTPREREELLGLCQPGMSSVDRICTMNVWLGHKLAQAALHAIRQAGMRQDDIDLVCSHGQTIYHAPGNRATLQIGELAVIAEETGCLTIGDFRPHDMAAGGQGAPLVPYVDYVLFRHNRNGRVLLNVGGISNVTCIPAAAAPEHVIAFDTGPGNVLIDQMVYLSTQGQQSFDLDGQIALQGHVDEKWLSDIIAQDSYLLKSPPKSTGREYYHTAYARKLYEQGKRRGLSDVDIVATITAYTVSGITANLEQFVHPKMKTDEIYISGGGRHNRALVGMLSEKLKINVLPFEKLGFPSDAKEAIVFAVLGYELLCGNANNLPSATGAKKRVPMGKIVFPSQVMVDGSGL
ncbi:anhydro-N-acetylmuramic acid kinase [Caldalkalibacillus uzonensis]|uniref:Anhydro-N-acetylmuramic acid kinase n=1 Tax=Caldalkalibacillus uzonensis TaxID=353224 RepID=A0ABU0CX90_9BACI|nr:anhydro-N-acetylmuramic acid kinase [Caldalkalibacillus uzonensis]MDQ0340872.1 anhydro-N-acetylmuramic acid kinase [Caldalkalibacillus uzonensis]